MSFAMRREGSSHAFTCATRLCILVLTVTAWADEYLARVEDLVPLVGSVEEARSLLQRLGVREENGIFSRRAFLAALEGRPLPPLEPEPDRGDVGDILSGALGKFGIAVDRLDRGKQTTAYLRAEASPRFFVSTDVDGVAPVELRHDSDVAARVYTATKRLGAVPSFTASGLTKDAPPVFLFVLVPERLVWGATRDALQAVERELRRRTARQTGRRSHDRPGFALAGARKGALRIWVPSGRGSGLHLGSQIVDEHGRFVHPEG